MRDLELFRRLRKGDVSPELAPDIQALSRLSLRRRAAWLAVLAPAFDNQHAQVRAAAVSVLMGCTGVIGLRYLTAALDDEDAVVRARAVDALRATAMVQPHRWAHALFHPRDDVRRRALGQGVVRGVEDLGFYLLADPACRDLAMHCAVPSHGLATLSGFVETGALAAERARQLLVGLTWEHWTRWLEATPGRSQSERRAASEWREPAGFDPLDRLMSCVWADDDASTRILRTWRHGLCAADGEPLRTRVLASLRTVWRQTDHLPAPAAGLATALAPETLLADLSSDALEGCLSTLREDRGRIPRAPGDLVRRVVASPVVRTDGVLDPRRLAAVLWLAEQPLATLHAAIGEEATLAMFRRDPAAASHLLALPDHPTLGHDAILRLIQRNAPELSPEVLAWSMLHRDADRTEPIDKLADDAVLPFVQAVLRNTTGRTDLANNRIEHLCAAISRRIVPKKKVRRLPILGFTPRPERVLGFLSVLAALDDPQASPLTLPLLSAVARHFKPGLFGHILSELQPDELVAALSAVGLARGISTSAELVLARHFEHHADPRVRAWSQREEPSPISLPASGGTATTLSSAQARTLATCTDTDLDKTLKRYAGTPSRGLASALAERPTSHESVIVCTALVGSHGRIEEIATQLERFRGHTDPWLQDLDASIVKHWLRRDDVPPLAHAWLWRWEKHAVAFTRSMVEGGLGPSLRATLDLDSPLVRDTMWTCVARTFRYWSYNDRTLLGTLFTDDLVDLLVELLDSELGFFCARMLGAIGSTKTPAERLEALHARLLPLLGVLDTRGRFEISPLVRAEGIAPRKEAPRPVASPEQRATLECIQDSHDLSWLGQQCASADPRIVSEATLRLIDLDATEQIRLAMSGEPPPPCFDSLAESVPLWPEGPALQDLRADVLHLPPAQRFRVALSLGERGESGWREVCLAAATVQGEPPWFRPGDWNRLLALGDDPLSLARALATAPHHAAYSKAVLVLLQAGGDNSDSLRAFLEVDHERHQELRVQVARALHDRGDPVGLPLLIGDVMKEGEGRWPLDDEIGAALVARGCLVLGGKSESVAVGALAGAKVPVPWSALLVDLSQPSARQRAAQLANAAVKRTRRRHKLEAVAEVFAWGVVRGLELCGRRFRIRMTAGHDELGHTRMTGSTINVSPLPLLRSDKRGREIVEGLVLHELGHHRYHGGQHNRDIWKKAQNEKLHGLLNLVADEHLERNLRAYDSGYGDRFKALAAYAFQHAPREVPVDTLLGFLQEHTFAVLSSIPLEVAYDPKALRLSSGKLMLAMERAGHSFARFVRALRMGLGNRQDDPKVAEALALFPSSFRKSSMDRLYQIAKELRRIFGDEAAMALSLGGSEHVPGDDRDHDVYGDGLSDREVQGEVERILRPPRQSKGVRKGAGGLVINVGDDHGFTEIDHVEPVPHNPVEQRALATEVARYARRMRQFLEELGLSMQPQRMRLRGSRFDPSRARAMVLRGDPRVLISREMVVKTDLFLGVVIDCSGSMGTGQSMDKAKRFGALLAESVRGLRGVDLRVIGFTDSVIYDAGDAERCAVSSLEVGGGNNDAAALLYMARLAQGSRRRAKLLVMISDGLPTECSVSALRNLTEQLGRKGMCVAQVAVRPLEEQCFRHYVVLEEHNMDAAVRKFGGTVAKLVRQAVRG